MQRPSLRDWLFEDSTRGESKRQHYQSFLFLDSAGDSCYILQKRGAGILIHVATEKRNRVLIVDDESLTRAVLQRNVILAGYDVLLASNGKEALETIARETPDLIIIDLVMPDMNGFEACRRIRAKEQTKKTPIIVVSALRSDSDVEDAKAAGADSFLVKPAKPEELKHELQKFLPSPFKTGT